MSPDSEMVTTPVKIVQKPSLPWPPTAVLDRPLNPRKIPDYKPAASCRTQSHRITDESISHSILLALILDVFETSIQNNYQRLTS